MGCGHCGTKKNGTLPVGCKDHGSCRTGACNRLNTHDWLSLIPVSDFSKPFPFVEISFNHGSRKDFYKTHLPQNYEKGDFVCVEGTAGYDIGVVSLKGELVKLQMKKHNVKESSEDIKKILRKANEQEIAEMELHKKKEKDFLIQARVIARNLNLDMKISEVEMQANGKKATFFYTADDRVDFRELIKNFANDFKVKIEMKQIGIRQEAAKVGGIGSCGRELCCSTWLVDFKSVSTGAARYQNLSINQTKLSGQCGRLKCCLNYELDTYIDALKVFPDQADKIKTKQGIAFLQKKDIFKNLMWYSFEKSNKLYPLTIERVKEIKELNAKNIFPDEIQAVEVLRKNTEETKTDYVDVVGQFSLKSLERASKKKKKKAKSGESTNSNRPSETQLEKPSADPKPIAQKPQHKQAHTNKNKQANKPKPVQNKQAPKPTPKPASGINLNEISLKSDDGKKGN
ncbi:MAG: regulatory iron-sulfur-containing complex subunit RicT [Chitinophagaceae bacterium]